MAKLYFRYGVMTCGKTTQLLQVAYNYERNNHKIILLKPRIDTKGNDTVVSRLGIDRKVDLLVSSEDNILDLIDLENTECIIVDEVQFLNDNQIKELWLITKLYNIPVIAYGLKTTFASKLFEGSKAILELADEIEEIATICECGKKARFNARIVNGEYTNEGDEVVIDDGKVEYVPLCPECYIKKVLKIDKENVKQKILK